MDSGNQGHPEPPAQRQMSTIQMMKVDGVYTSEKAGGIQNINYKEYVSVVFKHKYKILIVFLLVLLASPGAYFLKQRFLPAAYEAKSTLMVRHGREYSDVNPDPSGKTPLAFGRGDIFMAESLILNSRELKERIIAKIGMDRLFPDLVVKPPKNMSVMDAALIQFAKDLVVQSGRNSNTIDIVYRGNSPDIAAQVVNMLVEFYKEKRMDFLSDPKSAFFLDKKAAEYRQKLKEAEDNLESFKQKHQIFSYDSELNSLHGQRLELDNAVKAADMEMNELRHKLATLQDQIKNLPKASKSSPAVKAESSNSAGVLASKLMELRLKEKELLTKYTEKNLHIVNVRSEIKMIEESLEIERQKNPASSENVQKIEGVDITIGLNLKDELEKEKVSTLAQLGSLEIRVEALKQQRIELYKRVQALDAQEKKWRELQRQLSLNEKYYQIYLNKMEESRISDDMNRQEMSSIQVVQPAVPPPLPSGKLADKGLMFFVAAGALLGMIAGVAFAFLLEFISQGIRSPLEAEKRLGLPVLVAIPHKD